MKFAPNLTRRQSDVLYRGCVNLTFSAGFEQSRGKSADPEFAQQATAFSSIVLRVLCEDLLKSTAAAKQLAASAQGMAVDPRQLAPLASSIARTTSALTSVCSESSAMGPDGRQCIQSHMQVVIADLLECSTIFTCLSVGGSGSASVNNASSGILLLLLAVMDCLGRDLGVEFKTTCLDRLLAAFDREASTMVVTQSLMGVVKALLNMFRTIFSERSASLDALASDSCNVIATRLAPLCKDPAVAPELMPGLLSVVHCILSVHWKAFTVTVSETGGAVPVSPTGGGHPLFGGGGGGGGAFRGGLKKRVTRIIDESRYERMKMLVDIFLFCFQASGLPPACVGSCVKLLRDLNDKVGIFKLPEFQSRMRVAFVTMLLQDLLQVNQPSLVDDMSSLLYEMAAVDMANFFQVLQIPTKIVKGQIEITSLIGKLTGLA